MAALFADLPDALTHTRQLTERLEFTLENLGYRFPDFPDPHGKPLTLPEQDALLRQLTYQGAASRYGKCSSKVRDQLEKELTLISRLGFAGYFLIVHDIVLFARSKNMLCQGRGSAANSAVCYALGITGVDPVGGKLLFERFLSESRTSWPDIDIDFPSGDRREQVIQYVFQKYGPRGAAMTANVITYRPRSAFREMSKVLGFPLSLADRFSKQASSFRHEHEESPDDPPSETSRFEDHIASLLPPSHPRLPALSRLYHSVLGLPRHLGQHSGGIIICDRGLDSVVPIQPATMPGRTVVQWDKDDCEDLGIVKIDLLGLGILAAMEESFAICKSRGKPYDPALIPRDDPAVFELLSRVDTVGTFQVESRAQMATLPIMRPREFYDLAIQVAIIRPGPIVGDLVHPYLNRRTGKEAIDYIHPACQPILERTLGVPLFQEQMLRMAMDVAGFTSAEAEELRRAVSSKRSPERMEKVTTKLRTRMTDRGIPRDVQEKIIHATGSFSLYGFPESHAISFAWLAYLSCWLKAHHPAEFFAGLLNNQPMGFYSVNTLIQDGKRRGLRFLPVSCIHSHPHTHVIDDRTLRLGLHRIKGLSQSTTARLTSARDSRPFASLEDFLARVRPTATERRALARAGALNDLPEITHRRQAMWQAELPFHDDLLHHATRPADITLPMMSPAERLSSDFATQDSSTGPHPMKLWRQSHGHRSILRAADLAHLPHGIPITLAGLAICRQRPGTAKGHCFVSLEDETGISNLFIPKKTFHLYRHVIVTEPFLHATGHLQRSEGDQPTLYVTHIQALSHAHPEQAAISHDFH
jgi:error-prone DNA polymerase